MTHDRLHRTILQLKGATMATRIDLNKDIVKVALQLKINSLLRATKTEHNTLIKQLMETDIAAYQTAMNTLTDIK
jgi:hypothetical protein